MNEKKNIQLVITDLDDTIWDWLDMWYNSFSVFLKRISELFDIDEKELIKDFKYIHQKYHSSESSFIYNELRSLSKKQKDMIKSKVLPNTNKTILHEYYSLKKNTLHTYEGTIDFLMYLKERGVTVVGFTESNSFFAKYRIKHLNLDGLIDRIYAPKDFELPAEFTKYYDEGYWEPILTKFALLPERTMKPNPKILNNIISDYGIDKCNVIYIGDKLDRDVFMANQAGVISIYAKYGNSIDKKEYDLLRDVTHWTDEDVKREIRFKSLQKDTNPSYTVQESLMELIDKFNFIKTNGQ